MNTSWMHVENEAEVPSPALLIFPDRVGENMRRMLAIAGSPDRLRPHIKTHKIPQVMAMQVGFGIFKCKCAIVAEAEMAAVAGAKDILVAAQLVGPNIARFLELSRAYPQTQFSTMADDRGALSAMNAAAIAAGGRIEVLLDLDVGQHRTGIAPGPTARELYALVAALPGLRPGGLHAYDGHLHQIDPVERAAASDVVAASVFAFRKELLQLGLPVPRVVLGGTPTFPMHARRDGVECSPGTCVLWDAGYAAKIPDLDFLPAAVLLARVVSRPTPDRICLDLGHKAVASEMPHPRVFFPELPEARPVAHNEEHLVLETNRAAEFPVGSVLYGIPWHVCPTVALHDRVHVVRQGRVVAEWPVVARARKLKF